MTDGQQFNVQARPYICGILDTHLHNVKVVSSKVPNLPISNKIFPPICKTNSDERFHLLKDTLYL